MPCALLHFISLSAICFLGPRQQLLFLSNTNAILSYLYLFYKGLSNQYSAASNMTSLSDAFCYWPNGTIAQNTTSGEYALPCDTALGVSSCCLPGQSCDTQFRCEDAAGNIVEASCTQKDFNNPYCPCPHGIVSVDGIAFPFTMVTFPR